MNRVSDFILYDHVSATITELRKTAKEKNSTDPIRVLDIGSGGGEYWDKRVATDFEFYEKIELTLFDAVKPEAMPAKFKTEFVRGMLPSGLKDFGDSSFDIVVCFDVIEHLTKDSGYLLLYEIDRIMTSSAVVATPNGFVWQPPSENNFYNAHISGWQPREFRKMKWGNVRGHQGLKFMSGPYALRKPLFLRTFFGRALFFLTMPIARLLPRLAFSTIAISRAKKPRSNQHSIG